MTLILSGTDGLSDVDGSAATPAIRGTDANTGIFFPAADTIAFSEGGAEVMRIDSSGNVGIGTSSPDLKLSVAGGMNLRNSSRAGAFEIDSSGNLWSGTATTAGNIYFETGHSTTGLPSTGTARVTVNQYGLGLGATPSSGTGITFPATQSASSDANCLDDYEEGTWTPVLKFGGATTGITYSTQNGSYIKVGKNVFITLYILLSSKGSATGIASITGLPFSNAFSPAVVGSCGFDVNYTLTANSGLYSLTDSSSAQLLLRSHGASNYSDLSNTNFNNNTGFYVATTYVASA